jgi:hypothetical protein
MPATEHEYQLNCCFIHEPSRIFSVVISKVATADELKDAIKKKVAPKLDHIAASDLDLWKASIPVADLDTRKGDIQNPEGMQYAAKLYPTFLLSTIFKTQPVKQHLHVVVQYDFGVCIFC